MVPVEENYKLEYPIIFHENKKDILRSISLVAGVLCLSAIIILNYFYNYSNDRLLWTFVIIMIISVFIYSYSMFYKTDFKETGVFSIDGSVISIQVNDREMVFKKEELQNLRLQLNFNEYEPFNFMIPNLSSGIRKGIKPDGSENFIEFNSNGKFYSYELYIKNKENLMQLSRRIKDWKVPAEIV